MIFMNGGFVRSDLGCQEWSAKDILDVADSVERVWCLHGSWSEVYGSIYIACFVCSLQERILFWSSMVKIFHCLSLSTKKPMVAYGHLDGSCLSAISQPMGILDFPEGENCFETWQGIITQEFGQIGLW